MPIDSIAAQLARYTRRRVPVAGFTPSAVLLLLQADTANNGQLTVILTRRSRALAQHAGQVSFPGGRLDAGDATLEAAALRETQEELGIAPQAVRVLGRLDDHVTVTGFHVTPVLGWLAQEVALRPNPHEVERVFRVPLAALLALERWQQRTLKRGGAVGPHSERTVWHFRYDGEDIWGATAAMLRQFVELLHAGSGGVA